MLSFLTVAKDFMVGTVRGFIMGIQYFGMWGLRIGAVGGAIAAFAATGGNAGHFIFGSLGGAMAGILAGGTLGALFGGIKNVNDEIKHARAERVLAERARAEAMDVEPSLVQTVKKEKITRDDIGTREDQELNALTKKLSDTHWRDKVKSSRVASQERSV